MNSTKTIIDKLSLNKYPTKLIIGTPADIDDFNVLEYDSTIQKEQYDLIFMFVFSLEEFSTRLQEVINKQLLKDKGYIYVAYPKKNNPQYKEYIERDSIFPAINADDEGYVYDSNIKFSRMVSFNDVFTVVGLKSEPKKTKKSASSKSSQCVDDYIENINDIKQYLDHKEDLSKIFNELTPGYQKDWARYVYSAKRTETQEKRLLEMETVLSEGYKSIDLYKRSNK